MRLIQFQCASCGVIFYYQGMSMRGAKTLVCWCPSCRSKRVDATDRIYPQLDECAPLADLVAWR